MDDRIVILKLTVKNDKEMRIYQYLQDILNRMEDAEWVEHGATIIGAFQEVDTERLHR